MSTQTETRNENQQAWDQLLFDIFVTALEGGIDYWAEVTSYRWSNGDHGPVDEVQDLYGFYADISEAVDWLAGDPVAGGPRDYHVNRAVIARGYALASGREKGRGIAWSTEQPPFIVTADNVDDIDLDAGDCDVIVQLGLFGDVVYG